MTEEKKGIIIAIFMFIFLGVCPLYFKSLSDFEPLTILCLRVVLSFITLMPFFLYVKKFSNGEKGSLTNYKKLVLLAISGFLTGANWWLYIWAIDNDKTIEASLGYFISPILSIFFGVIFFGDSVSRLQQAAILIVLTSVGFSVFSIEGFPFISFMLALTYSLYGLLRKYISVNPFVGVFYETLTLSPLAFFILNQELASVKVLVYDNVHVLFSGVVTCIPLLLFGYSISRVKYSIIGILQYIGPTVIFLIAIFVFDEEFSTDDIYIYSGVCFGVFFYLLSYFFQQDKNNSKAL